MRGPLHAAHAGRHDRTRVPRAGIALARSPPEVPMHPVIPNLAAMLAAAVIVDASSPKIKYDATAERAGADLNQTHCTACPGPDARGGGPQSRDVAVAPPDLT